MKEQPFFYKLFFAVTLVLLTSWSNAQVSFPENGIADLRHGYYAFTNATIIKETATTLKNATLVIRDGKIVTVGDNIKVPAGAVEVNCKGKFIYPSFIDLYADYGTSLPTQPATAGGAPQQPQLKTNTRGPYGWNQAIRS